jgi:RHS repeat-associated protein
VRLTTDASGNLLSQQGTFPFGESWYQQGAGNKMVFTSYDRDSESGLDYAMARYYNSTTGTFLMVDPVEGKPGDPQSWNRYVYSRNDPIDLSDPSGQHWWSWLITAGAIGADIFTAGAATGFTMATLESVGEGIGENLAIGVASNAIQTGHLGINEGDLEGAAIGGALSGAEGLANTKIMPHQWLEAAPIHYAENAFNSLVENGVVNGHAKVDWIGAGISTGIDMLNDYATKNCSNGNPESNVDGHHETTTVISPGGPSGFTPYPSPFGNWNGFRNTSLFMQTHYNGIGKDIGQYFAGIAQKHVDVFNPNWGGAGATLENGVGIALHGTVDYGIGKLFFRNSPALDPGCIF